MQINKQKRGLIGIVGGMGPLASTAFLSTIYEMTGEHVEQCAGRLVLYSDPSIPGRTEALLHNRDALVYEPFVGILKLLYSMEIHKIIVCCVTIHHIFPQLPLELKENIVSLVDTVFSTLKSRKGKHLLLCTKGTMQLEIFQNHQLWKNFEASIILPDQSDQNKIHSMTYKLKQNENIKSVVPILEDLLRKCGVSSFIAGCTEIHLLSRYLMLSPCYRQEYKYIDPLMILAEEIVKDRL